VAKVFLIQAIVMCSFSILAIKFYENIGKVFDYDGVCGPCNDEYVTSPGDCIGDTHDGISRKSLYTVFQE